MSLPPAQADPIATRLRPYLALAGLSLLFFLITAGTFTSLGVVLPDMVGQLHWSWSEAGLGYTLLALSCGLASYAPTLLVRRFGVRMTLYAGSGLMAAGYLLNAQCGPITFFWTGSVLLGIGFSLTAIIPGTYVLARSFSHKSTAIGLYYTAGALGGVAGPILYSLARSETLDWRGYWLAQALAMVVVGTLAALAIDRVTGEVQPDQPAETPLASGDWSVRAALRTPQFWIITAAYTAYLLCETSLNGLSVAHMTSRGLTPAIAAAMLSLQALVNAGARAVAGWLGERIDPRRLAIFAMSLVTLGIGALAVASGQVMVAMAVTAVGVGYGVSYLATTVLLLNAFGRSRNLELMSLMCLVSTLAAAGPLIGGLVKDASGGFAPAFELFAVVAALSLAALILMQPPARAINAA